jgi:hypothetical protein
MGDDDADDTLRPGSEDRLPWLEAVEEEEGDSPSITKLVAAIVIGLVAIGVIVGGLFWLGNRGQDATGEVIAAPEGDYKVRPANPGGMNVTGEGDVSAAASAGQQPQGNLNVNAVPEAPVTAAPQVPAAAPRPAAPAPAPATAPSPAPRSAPAQPAAPGGTIQLGAFSSGGAANGAWASLSGRFRYLAPLSHSVVTAEVNGRTYYRLRASGPGASNVCHRLQAAGETCAVVN